MKAELFLIRYRINQAVQVQNVENIIVITYTLQDKYLAHSSIHINYIQLLYHKILELSLIKDLTVQSLFGIVLAVPNGILIWLLTKKPNSLTLNLFSHVNHYGTLARKKSTIQFFTTGKCHSKCWIIKRRTS